MWQERLPRERGERSPKQGLRALAGTWATRLTMGAIPLLVVAAVVVSSFGWTLVGELTGAAAVLLVAALAAEPIWLRSRRRAKSWWR